MKSWQTNDQGKDEGPVGPVASFDPAQVLDVVTEIACYLDLDLRLQWANHAGVKWLGPEPGEWRGRHCYEIWHKRSAPCPDCAAARAMASGKPEQAEIAAEDGTFWLVRSYPVKDKADKLVGTVQLSLDVTDRKKVEQALRAHEDRLLIAQRTAHLGNWDWKLATGDLYWSPENYRIFGFDPDKVAPSLEKFFEAVEAADRDMVKKAIEEALSGKKPYDVDMRIVRPDGTRRWVNARAQVVFDKAGAPILMSGTVQDITDRKQIEERLQLGNALLDNASDSIFLHDFEGNFIYVNDAACRVHGYTRDDLLNMRLPELDAPESATLIQQRLSELMEKGAATFEVGHYHKSGSVIPMEVHTRTFEFCQEAGLIGAVPVPLVMRGLGHAPLNHFLRSAC